MGASPLPAMTVPPAPAPPPGRFAALPQAIRAGQLHALLLFLLLVPLLLAPAAAPAAATGEVMPPPPPRHVQDAANVLSPETRNRLLAQLEAFEQSDSSQVVVAIFPRMESTSSLEDYVHRLFTSWKIGREGRNNGILLAVFVQDRRLRIEVGYGLEGVIPDALAKRIIDEQITPRFKKGDYNGGITAGVNGILAAARGEYRGTGRTVAQERRPGPGPAPTASPLLPFGFVIIAVIVIWSLVAGFIRSRGTVYDRRGRRTYRNRSGWDWDRWIRVDTSSSSDSSSSSSWSFGGGGSDSGSSFSGGGGDSGGGGASGSW